MMVRLSPQIWLPLSCSRATAAVSALAKRTMATLLSCSNGLALSLLQQQAIVSCSRAATAASAAASLGHLLVLPHPCGALEHDLRMLSRVHVQAPGAVAPFMLLHGDIPKSIKCCNRSLTKPDCHCCWSPCDPDKHEGACLLHPPQEQVPGSTFLCRNCCRTSDSVLGSCSSNEKQLSQD